MNDIFLGGGVDYKVIFIRYYPKKELVKRVKENNYKLLHAYPFA